MKVLARPATNAITYNDVNASEVMFIIKSAIMNIFFPTSWDYSPEPSYGNFGNIQHVKLYMKNENKTTGVMILIFPGKNAFSNQRKSLQNDSAKLFVT